MRRTWSLQQRLMVLLLAALLPLLLLSVWVAVRETEATAELSRNQLSFAASLLAAAHDGDIDSARHMLTAVSATPFIRRPEVARCQMYFEELKRRNPAYANIGLLAPDGRVVCHAYPDPANFSAAERRFFQDALTQRRLAIGEAMIGAASGRWAIPVAMPVEDGGQVTGVVFATMDLVGVSAAMGRTSLPPDARVTVADRHGRVLIDHPRHEDRPTPYMLKDAQLLEAARNMRAGAGQRTGEDGRERLYALAPSLQVGEEGFMVRVDMARERISLAGSGRLLNALLTLAVTLLVGVTGAWWIGRDTIVRPARAILRAAHHLQSGKLDTRVPVGNRWHGGEFARIGSAFNLMAESLELRQRDLEAELGRSQAAYETLDLVLNSMPDGLVAISRSGEILMYNEAALATARALLPEGTSLVPAGQWARAYGLHHADGKTLFAVEDLPVVRATRGESGDGIEVIVRNARVPQGRRVRCSFRPMRDKAGVSGGLIVFKDVTDVRRAEADLVLLREAVSRLNDIVLITEAAPLSDPNRRIVFVNEAFERLTGFTEDEAIGSTPAMLYGPKTDHSLLARMSETLQRGGPARAEVMHYTRDGRELCLELDIAPLVEEGGRVTHLIAVKRDITERKDAEQALVASERELQMFTAMLQRTAEAAQAITRQQTLRGTLQEVTHQARLVTGAHQAIVSLATEADWSQAVTAVSVSQRHAAYAGDRPPPDASGIYAAVSEAGRPLRLSRHEMQSDPRWRDFGGPAPHHAVIGGLLALPLSDRSGRKIGLLLLLDKEHGDFNTRDEYVGAELAHLASIAIENARLFQQIRELNAGLEMRIAERTAELGRQQARYRALAEQAPEVIWNADSEGRATFLNRAWSDLVGGTADEWLGDKWTQRIHPEDLPAMADSWRRSRETLQAYAGTRRILGRDGRWHTMSYRATPVLDEGGQVAFWVGIDSDITELKSIEQALRNSNQELQAFSYSVSHDLRAPLGAIGGFSKALALKLAGVADERSMHYLARIQAGVVKMEQLIDATLSLAKVARAPLKYGPVDLGQLARETMEGFAMQQPERQVRFQLHEGLMALGDTALLRIVMENLLGNAWKFTSGRETGEIEVGSRGEGVFFVRDNGAGFDMAYAGKLFGAFQRLHTEAEFPGTGIGLATVRRIIARHRGRVWAESQPDKGTTFLFSLSDTAPPAWLAGEAEDGR